MKSLNKYEHSSSTNNRSYFPKEGISKISKIKSLFLIPGLLLFFMMLFVPTSYQSLKGIILALTIGLILIGTFKRKKVALAPQTLFWVLTWVCSGLFFMLVGSVNNNPGALRVVSVYVLWPIVYLLFIIASSNEEIIRRLLKVLIFSSVIIGIHSLSYILYSYGWLPSALYIELDLRQSIGFYSGMMAYSMNNTATLIFLVPFLICIIMTWPKEVKQKFNKLFIVTGLLLGILLTLLSGRRILQLLVVATPILIVFYQKFLSNLHRKRSKKSSQRAFLLLFLCVVLIYLLLNWTYGINITTIIEDIKDAFRFSTDASASLRSGQFRALLNGWSESPLIGSGHGASAPQFIRSTEQPWAYELSYVAYLYHTGLVGFSIFSGQIIWIIIMSIKIIKSNSILKFHILPVIVGSTAFLLANATNPYLAKYDFMWVIFLPICIINTWLLRDHKGGQTK
ncbi:O-antigen ligase family protein [Alkaliphilus peptidifermentans]|uniref:O-antigen ligase-related domain-containing protein n=1 Tax=Alkaliphilus peptidifermentans DSM 18978 TaxID=1120976 RepID=A0A1G5AHH5_9FIRM|nr:O-antigen ligase family protein [Alkaliphilus peptidifermentans]SCX77342.1 hypothetical protein SAMN03080606_00138 [Alkaliphilus peptidifermentans DSM 18978]